MQHGRASGAGCCRPVGLKRSSPSAGTTTLRPARLSAQAAALWGLCCGTRAAGQPLNSQQNQVMTVLISNAWCHLLLLPQKRSGWVDL